MGSWLSYGKRSTEESQNMHLLRLKIKSLGFQHILASFIHFTPLHTLTGSATSGPAPTGYGNDK